MSDKQEDRLAKALEVARERAANRPQMPRLRTAVTNRASQRAPVKRRKK